MKKLFLIVVILCSVGALCAQETSSVTDTAALLVHLETAAGFVIGGEIANLIGLGLVVSYYPQDGFAGGWGMAATAIQFVSIVPTISYAIFLENYNSLFPADRQTMLPYLLLTFGGAAAAIPIDATRFNRSGGESPPHTDYPPPSAEYVQRVKVAEVLGAVGALSYAVGAIVAVVHTQELLAKAKASGTSPVVQSDPQPTNRSVVMPEIGIGYFGVAISMP